MCRRWLSISDLTFNFLPDRVFMVREIRTRMRGYDSLLVHSVVASITDCVANDQITGTNRHAGHLNFLHIFYGPIRDALVQYELFRGNEENH